MKPPPASRFARLLTPRSLGVTLIVLASPFLAVAQNRSVFGETTRSEAALVGVLYDFKQTQDHTETSVTRQTYSRIIEEFLLKNWDERVLNRYYRVSRPLYTTQIFVPMIDADAAPRAFGVEKLVRPSLWLAHYKAQVSAPTGGVWRFVGAADDMLAVAVNRKTVLVANRFDTVLPNIHWRPSDPDGPAAANNPLRHGDWISLKPGEIIDLDVIIGERPGGTFNAFLFIEKKGLAYARDPEGYPILPIFQVAPYNTPTGDTYNTREGTAFTTPPFANGHPPWKSYQ
ncbi:MAG TPA: hypothetical protein VIM44_06205 [Rariglobus sp.]